MTRNVSGMHRRVFPYIASGFKTRWANSKNPAASSGHAFPLLCNFRTAQCLVECSCTFLDRSKRSGADFGGGQPRSFHALNPTYLVPLLSVGASRKWDKRSRSTQHQRAYVSSFSFVGLP
jgi:hypothetical protein